MFRLEIKVAVVWLFHALGPEHAALPSDIIISVRLNQHTSNALPIIPDAIIARYVHAGRAADESSFWMGNDGIDQNGVGLSIGTQEDCFRYPLVDVPVPRSNFS